jgi:hypothetical protein
VYTSRVSSRCAGSCSLIQIVSDHCNRKQLPIRPRSTGACIIQGVSFSWALIKSRDHKGERRKFSEHVCPISYSVVKICNDRVFSRRIGVRDPHWQPALRRFDWKRLALATVPAYFKKTSRAPLVVPWPKHEFPERPGGMLYYLYLGPAVTLAPCHQPTSFMILPKTRFSRLPTNRRTSRNPTQPMKTPTSMRCSALGRDLLTSRHQWSTMSRRSFQTHTVEPRNSVAGRPPRSAGPSFSRRWSNESSCT